jgi:FHA domain-containing protein
MSTAALLVPQPDGSIREVALPGEQIVLGRDPGCDIALEGRLISRRHARICRVGQSYTLEDLGSRNGTAVNGQPLDGARVLRDGDQIELGGVGRLIFVDGDSTSTRPMPHAVGVWLDAATQDVWVDGRRLSPALSLAQFNLLQELAAHADQICTRDQIVAAVWPDVADGISDEAIDALVKRVRARLGEVPNGQQYLKRIRGRGLMLRTRIERPQP